MKTDKEKEDKIYSEFTLLLCMIVLFILFLITLVCEITSHASISDIGLFLIVILTVTVIPALGRYLYTWMIADNEDESERDELSRHRTAQAGKAALIFTIIMLIRLLSHIF